MSGYDLVLFDTSPVLTPLNVAILYAVTEVLIPIDPCIAALAGVRTLEDLVRDVAAFREELTEGGNLAITGVLITLRRPNPCVAPGGSRGARATSATSSSTNPCPRQSSFERPTRGACP